MTRRSMLASSVVAFGLMLFVGIAASTAPADPVTTGQFELVIGPNEDGSAQMAFIADIIVKQPDGSKTKDPFCRSGNPPQFPNPVKAANVAPMLARYNVYRSTLQSLGFVNGFFQTTRAITPAEVGDFRSVTLTCLADMIALANQ